MMLIPLKIITLMLNFPFGQINQNVDTVKCGLKAVLPGASQAARVPSRSAQP